MCGVSGLSGNPEIDPALYGQGCKNLEAGAKGEEKRLLGRKSGGRRERD